MPDDDLNPSRPTPHGTPDRRYVDRTPRTSERIPPAELAQLIDEFTAREFPEKRKRKRMQEPPNALDQRDNGDDWDRGEQ